MSARDQFEVNGTRFSFGALPDEESRGVELARDRREKILADAAKVKFKPLAVSRPAAAPKPGTGKFVPKRGDAGWKMDLDGKRLEVWAVAPLMGGQRARWCTAEGSHSYWSVDARSAVLEVDAEAQRAEIIAAVQERARWFRIGTVVEAGETARMKELDDRRIANMTAEAVRHPRWRAVDRAREWADALIAHELYPDHYPHPGAFETVELEVSA